MDTLHRNPWQTRALVLAVASCFAGPVQANPAGGTVIGGGATFNNQGNTLTVTNTPGAVINWGAFSIGRDEITRFIQQNAQSAVLNRVIGSDPSQILGTLSSNGRVYLINPNGITFGRGSVVDVGGLVASSLNLSNQDFSAGRNNFTQVAGAGKIVNQGTISAASGGQIYLVASGVENSGVITAPNGNVLLAAGKSASLVDSANPDIRVEITAPDNQALNVGSIVGRNIGIYGGLVRQAGVVNANAAVVGDGGKIVFKAVGDVTLDGSSVTSADGAKGGAISAQSTTGTTLVSGTVSAKGTTGRGGAVQLLGDRVGLVDRANVDASGATGGGSVLVGGDFQGKNALVQNASRSFVGPDARISADAIDSGDGGKVVVWSDDITRYYGNISVRGGAQSGDGGKVEVSGAKSLDFQGMVDAFAPSGKTGSLLLDPTDIKLIHAASGTGTQDTFLSGTGLVFGDADHTTNTVSDGALNALGNVDVTLQAKDNISIGNGAAAAINLTAITGAHTLTLQAGDVATVGGGNVSFFAGSSITMSAGGNVAIIAGDSTVQHTGVATLGAITTNGGNLSVTSQQGMSLNGAISTSAGTVLLRANQGGLGAGSFTQNSGGTIATSDTSANAVKIQVNNAGGSGGVSLADNITTGAGGTVTVDTNFGTSAAGGSIAQSSGVIGVGSGGSVSLTTPTAGTSGVGTSVANIQTSSGAGTLNLSLAAGSAGAFVGDAGDVTLATPLLNANSPLSVIASGTLTLPGTAILTGTGALTLKSLGGSLSVTQDLTALNAITLFGSTGLTLTSGKTVNAGTATVSLGSDAGAVTVNNASVLTTGTVDVKSDQLTVGATGQLGGAAAFTGAAATVIVEPWSASTTIGIAGGAGTLALAAADLDRIRATNVRIGNANAGAISINTWAPAANFAPGVLTLYGNGITQGGAIDLSTSGSSLLLRGLGNATLGSANIFSNVAASKAGGGTFSITNAATHALTVASLTDDIGTQAGISTGGGVTLTASGAGGSLALNESVVVPNGFISLNGNGITLASGKNVDSGNAAIGINAGAGGLTINNGAILSTGGVDILGDSLSVGATGQIGGAAGFTGTASRVTIAPSTTTTTIGIAGGAGTLALTAANLDRIRATNVRIGDANSDAITINAWAPAANFAPGVLTLYGNGITQGGVIDLSAGGASLLVRGAGAVTLNSANVFTNLAANKSAGALSLTNAATKPLTVANLTDDLGAQPGITAPGGASLTASGAGGSLTLNERVSTTNTAIALNGKGVTLASGKTVDAGSGTITIDAGGGAVQLNDGNLTSTNPGTAVTIHDASTVGLGNIAAGSGAVVLGNAQDVSGATTQHALTTVTANTLTVSSAGSVDLSTSTNAIANLGAITAAGGFSLTDGSVTVTAGINTTNNAVSINAGSGTYTQNDVDIATGNGPVTIIADQLSIAANTGHDAIQTSGMLTLKPASAATAMSLAGASTFNLTAANLADVLGGLTGGVVIGDSTTSTGTMTIGAAVNFGAHDVALNAGAVSNGNNAGRTVTAQNLQLVARTGDIGGSSGNNAIDVASNTLSVTTLGTGNAYLTSAAAVDFANSSVGGNLALTAASGNITDSGNITVAGTASFTTNAADASITLNNNFAVTGAVDVHTNGGTSGDVTLVGTGPILLGTSSVGRNLDVTAAGSITQAGTLTVGSASSFTVTAATSDVLLGLANDLGSGGTTVAKTGAGTVHDVNLRTSNATPGTLTLAPGINNLTLTYDNSGIVLAAVSTAGNLTVSAGGNITESGVLDVTGAASFTAGSGKDIQLATQANDFHSTVTLAASAGNLNDVGVRNADATPGVLTLPSPVHDLTLTYDNAALTLPSTTVTGNLAASAGGSINQAGAIAVTGSSNLSLTAAGSDVLLAGFANNFGNNVGIGGTGANVRDFALRNINAGATVPDFSLLSNLRNLTLIFNSAAIDLPALTLTNGGNLVVSAGGDITDSGAVTVPGTASFTASVANKNITLDSGLAVTGAIDVHTTGTGDVTIINATGIDFATSGVGRNLTATATTGDITQSGALTVNGVGAVATFAANAGNNVTLNTTPNNFREVAIASGNNVALDNGVNAIKLGASTISGNLSVSSGTITQTGVLNVSGVGKVATFAAGAGNNVTLNTSANNFAEVAIASGNNVALDNGTNALKLGASTVSGNLTVSSGAISQTGVASVTGTSNFTAGANTIDLTQSNAFTGAVSLANSGANNVALTNGGALVLGTLGVGSGTLDVVAGGHITQAGATTQAAGAGTATFSVTAAASDILLSQANDFTGTVAIGGTASNVRDLNLHNTDAAPAIPGLGGLTNLRNLTLTFDNANITLPAITTTGNLTVSSGGNVTESGVLDVTGAASFTAGSGKDIQLATQANDFHSTVTLAASAGNLNDVGVRNADATPGVLTLPSPVHDLTLTYDNAALTLPSTTVTGNLAASAGGSINQAGAIAVTGSSNLSLTAAGSDVLLAGFANNFGNNVGIGGTGANVRDFALRNINAGATVPDFSLLSNLRNLTLIFNSAAIDLPALTLTNGGNLVVSAGGDITDSGAVTVPGTASFTASVANKNITLDSGLAVTGAIDVHTTGTGDVTIINATGIDFATSGVGRNLTATATTGDITQSGALTVNGVGAVATFAANAGNNVTLNTTPNNFREVAIASGNNVALDNGVNAIKLGASTISGNLSVSSGTITQTGVLNVSGVGKVATFAAGAGNNVTLNTSANNFAEVAIASGNNVALDNGTNALKLGASTVSGNLTVSSGAISQTGVASVTGTSNFTAGANTIDLTQSNAFTGAVSLANSGANNVALTNGGALVLGTLGVGSGTLDVVAGGHITQAGATTQAAGAGTATFSVTAAASDILLSQANDFTGTVAIGGTASNVRDLNLHNTDAAPAIPGLGGLTNLRNLTLTFDNANITLPAITTTGNLTVSSGGNVTESGVLDVTGAASFTAGSGKDIQLATQANDFHSTVTLAASAGNLNDVGVRNADATPGVLTLPSPVHDLTLTYDNAALTLPSTTVTGNLAASAGGSINQAGAIAVTGSSNLSLTAAGSDVLLAGFANNFGNNVGIGGTGANVRDFALRNINAGATVPDFSLLSNLRNLTLIFNSAAIDLPALTLTNGGNLVVSAGGDITDSGAVTVPGTASFTASVANKNITLDSGLAVTGAIDVHTTGTGDVTIINATGIDFATSGVGRNLTATATTGDITQSGALTVNGVGAVATFAANAGNNVTLNTTPNNFREVAIASGNNVALDNGVNAIKLGASTISGNLSVSSGTITQTGVLAIAGTSSFTLAAAASDVLLGTQANDLGTGSVTVANNGNARDVDLRNVNATPAFPTLPALFRNLTLTFDNAAIVFPALNLTGNLTVTAGGAITQTGIITANGAGKVATFTVGIGNNITLNSFTNDFTEVSVVSGNNVSFKDGNALKLGASTISGNLDVATAGAITQTGVLDVSGAGKVASFTAGAGNDITLNSFTNDFTEVAVVSGNNVSFTDGNALKLGASTISGNLDVATAGAITQTGIITANGAGKVATFTAGAGNNITLNSFTNDFTEVAVVSGNNVSFKDGNALKLGASTISGNLDVATAGAITQTGIITANGAGKVATFTAGAGNNITLNTSANNIAEFAVVSGNNVALDNGANALKIGASTISGNLNVNSGAITQTGVLDVSGAGKVASFTAGAGNDITLNTSANNIAEFAVVSGNNVALDNGVNAVKIGASTISGNLNVNSGAITQTGIITANGAGKVATFTVGAGNDITLNSFTNDFSEVSVVSGNNVSFKDGNALKLGASTISGNLDVATAGAITQTGVLDVSGAGKVASFTAGAGNDITLNTSANNIAEFAVVSGNNVALDNGVNAVKIGASTISGNLNVNSGAITQTGIITANGAGKVATFTAGAGNNITLNSFTNDFTEVAVVSGNNVSFKDGNALKLGASTISGNLDVATAGAITQTGIITANGAGKVATFTAGAGNNITLNTSANNIAEFAVVSGNNVALDNGVNAVKIGASTISGNLNVNSGAITQTGIITANGAGKVATFTAGAGNNITLNSFTNDFTEVAVVSGNNVSFKDGNALKLGASTISGNLDVATAGAITQTGIITANGAGKVATFTAGAGNDITLNSFANDFTEVSVVSGNNVSFKDGNALKLGASTISGNLDVATAGAITQTGVLDVSGAGKVATFTAGAGNDITLNTSANNIAEFAVVSGNNVALDNGVNAVKLGASTISGNLDVSSGAITQTGVLSVTGTSNFNSGANAITLANAANHFTGTITLATAGGTGDATLVNNAVTDLGTSTIGHNLDVTAAGHITESGVLTVTGASNFTVSAANSDILLATQGNNFGGIVSITNNGNVRDLGLRNVNAGATVPVLPAGLRNLTLIFDNAAAMTLPAMTLTGTLDATAIAGDINESGIVVVPGVTTLSAGGNINLGGFGNDFSTVAITTANNASLKDANAIILGTSTVLGNLDVTTVAGAITQSGTITANGAGKTATFSAAGNNITLADPSNDFTTLAITSAANVTVQDANAIDLGSITATGTVAITAGANITDSGSVSAATLNTTSVGGAILDFGHAVAAFSATNTGGGNIQFVNTGTLDVTSVSQTGGGSVNIDNTGNLSNSGAISAGGAGGVSLTAHNGNLTLGALVSTAGAGSVSLTTTGGASDILLNANASSVSGTLDANSGHDVVLNAGSLLGAAAVNVTAANAINEAGAGKITGALLTTQSANGTMLNAANAVSGLNATNTTSGDVQFTNTGALGLAAQTTGGNVTVANTGTLSSTGAIGSNGGNVTLTSTGDMSIGHALTASNGVDLHVTGVDNFINHTAGTISTTNAAINLVADKMALSGGTIDAGNATITLRPNVASGKIDIGSVTDLAPGTLELSSAELATLVTSGNIAIGDALNTGAITISAATNIGAGATSFDILNNTGDITVNATLTSAIDTNLTSAGSNIVFGPAGAINVGGNNVALSALAGFIDGGSALGGFNNIAANNLTMSAANGMGATNFIETAVNNVTVHNSTSGNVQIFNNGPVAIGGVDNGVAFTQTPGDFSLYSTGAVSQTGAIYSQVLNVTTFNTPGADINLPDITNHTTAFNLFACLALPVGCPPGGMPPGAAGSYAAGNITYNDSGGSSVSGIGTISSFNTYSAGNLNFGPGIFVAQNVGIEASGNITFTGFTGLGDAAINGGVPGGSIAFVSGGSITYDSTPGGGSFGTAGARFNHDVTFKAGGDVSILSNLFLGANNFTVLANQSFVTPNQNVVATGIGAVTLTSGTADLLGAGGKITLLGDTINGGTILKAETVQLNANNGIGNTGTLNLLTQNLTGVTGAGAISLINSSNTPVLVTNLASSNGNIDYLQTGSGSVTFNTVSSAGRVILNNTSGDLTVATSVNSLGNDVNLLGDRVTLTGTTTAAGIALINGATSINGSGLVTGQTVKLFANGGIGNTTEVKTSSGLLFIDAGTGDIDVANDFASAVAVNTLHTTSGNITLIQTGGGALDFLNPVSGGGNVTITNKGSDLTIDSTLTAGGNVALTAAGVLRIDQKVSGGTGVLLKTTGTGDILVNNDVTTTTGLLEADSAHNLTLASGSLTTAGDVTLNAGAVIEETGTGIVNGVLLTTTSVGGTKLNNQNVVTAINASNTKSGNIEFTNDGKNLSIAGINQAGGGDAIIVTSGDLSADGALLVADAGKLDLRAALGKITQADASVITSDFLVTSSKFGTLLDGVNQVVQFTATNTDSGDIRLNNASDLLTLDGVLQSGGGNVSIRNVVADPALKGRLDISGDGVDAGTGNINFTTSGDISQSGAVKGKVLNVTTLNDAGAKITLGSVTNHADEVNLYSCVAAGCGQGASPNYAAGDILYADSGDTNIRQIGTRGGFAGYAAGALNFTADKFSARDATLEGTDVTFSNFAGLANSQLGAGGFLKVIAGRDIVYDGVALGGLIGDATTAFQHDLSLIAGRDIRLGSGIYTGTGLFTIAANQDVKTGFQDIKASTYQGDAAGTVSMYGNNQIKSLGSIDITGRNFAMLGGRSSTAGDSAPGTSAPPPYVNPNAQSAIGQQLIADGSINLRMTGDVTIQAGGATAISGSGAEISANAINIGSADSRVKNLILAGGTSLLTAAGNRLADATVDALTDLNIYAGSISLTGGTVTGAALAADQVRASAGAMMTGKSIVIDTTGNLVLQGGTVSANALASSLDPLAPFSSANASALILASTVKSFHVGGDLLMTGGDTTGSVPGTLVAPSKVIAQAGIQLGKINATIGGDVILTGGTGKGADVVILSSDTIVFTIGGAIGMRQIGGKGSGLFDAQSARLDGTGFPISLVFTGGGNFKIIGDVDLSDGFVQTAAGLNFDQLANFSVDAVDRTKTKRMEGFYDDRSMEIRIKNVTTEQRTCR